MNRDEQIALVLRQLDTTADTKTLRAGLAHRACRVNARAAELTAEGLCYELESDLIAAFRRLAGRDHKQDPGCVAKGAIARALVTLECLDAAFYREGIVLRQLEPVWGGSVDTAADVRASCAMGLAASGDARALITLVDLLADAEHQARIGAVRAIVCTEPLAAEAVLRAKVVFGDNESDVIGECLHGLLELEPDASPQFVAHLLGDPNPELAELAALALGESRLDAGVLLLRAHWEDQPLKRPRDLVLLRAATLARSDLAFDWLLRLIREADPATAEFVVKELSVYHANQSLATRVESRAIERDDAALLRLFDMHWHER
ncbi:MAG: hypothetical protein WBG92_01535 [Thiohalocapsa sp.]